MNETPQINEKAPKQGRHPIVTGTLIGCGIIFGLFLGVQACGLIYLLTWNQSSP